MRKSTSDRLTILGGVLGVVVPVVVPVLVPEEARAQCPLAWSDQTGSTGISGTSPTCATTYTDSQGTWLVLGGQSTYVAGSVLPRPNGLLRWNDGQWRDVQNFARLEDGMLASGGSLVRAAASFDPDGAGPLSPVLVVGGSFMFANGEVVQNIAAWNGSEWQNIGTLNGIVRGMAAFDPDDGGPLQEQLYITGGFTTANGASARGLAVWDGSELQGVTTPALINGNVLRVIDDDGPGGVPPALYVGHAAGLRRWDGTSWSVVSHPNGTSGVNDVETLPMPDGSSSLWVSSQRVHRRIGTVWTTFSNTHAFAAIEPFQGRMYVGKAITPNDQFGIAWADVNSTSLTIIAETTSPQPQTSAAVGPSGLFALDLDGGGPQATKLVVTGDFYAIGTQHFPQIAFYDGATFTAPTQGGGAGGLSGSARAMVVFDPDDAGPLGQELFIGGSFYGGGQVLSPNCVRFNGSAYSPCPLPALPSGDPQYPTTYWQITGFAVVERADGLHLYASGLNDVPYINGLPAGALLHYENGQFVAKHTSADGAYNVVSVPTAAGMSELWAFGLLHDIDGAPRTVASFDGTNWTPRTAGLALVGNTYVSNLCVHTPSGSGASPVLVLTTTDSDTGVFTFYTWNGSAWTPMSPAVSVEWESPTTFWLRLASHEGMLYACGPFTGVSGTPALNLARFDGTAWSAVDPEPARFNGASAISVIDDGTERRLAVVCTSTTPGENYVLRAGGAEDGFNTLASVDGLIYAGNAALAWYNGGLYLGGTMNTLDAVSCAGIGRLEPVCPPCRADFNASGSVTVQDIFDFLAAWFAGVPAADFNNVSGVSVQDIFDFLAAWFAGC